MWVYIHFKALQLQCLFCEAEGAPYIELPLPFLMMQTLSQVNTAVFSRVFKCC